MKIHTGQYTFKAKVNNKFVDIKHYTNSYYNKDQIQNITKEIEQEYPEYKNKIIPFEIVLENNPD